MIIRTPLAWVLATFVAGTAALAQPLADQVPDDAIVYVGWKGAKSLGPGYEQSRLKGVLEAANIDQLFSEFLPKLRDQVARQDAKVAQVLELVSTIGPALWNHPTAIYFGGIDTKGPGPAPKFAILCEAGDDSKALLDSANKIIERLGEPPFPVSATQRGKGVLINVGRTAYLDREPLKPLIGAAKFKSAMGHVGKDPVYAVYVDTDAIVKLIDQAAGKADDPNNKWHKAREALGIDSMHSMLFAGGFDGKDWMDHGFIDAPAPRKGLVGSLMGSKPLSQEALRLVPQSATMFGGGRLDLSGLFTGIREMIGKLDPQAQARMDQGLSQLSEMLGGLDLNKDILATLGPEWVIYSAPDVTGNGITGLVLLNRLADPARAEKALTQLEQTVSQIIAQQMRGGGPQIAFRQTKIDGLTIHYLGIPVIAPGWAIKDGTLYVGLFPQVIAGAANRPAIAGKQSSILDNEAYQAVMKRLGAPAAGSVSFADLPKTAPDAYQLVLLITRTYLGMADLFGIQAPTLIPPINKLMPHLAPAGSVTWIDDAGWHSKSLTPFPGAEMFGGQLGALTNTPVAVVPMGVAVLLPALNAARERANRIKCAADLSSIGKGCMLYAMDHKDAMPQNLGQLVVEADVSAECFVCPSGGTEIPPDLRQPRQGEGAEAFAARQAAWVNANTDYVYLGAGKKMSALKAMDVLAYEKPGAHGGEGANVLFGDGHAEWFTNEGLQALLKLQE